MACNYTAYVYILLTVHIFNASSSHWGQLTSTSHVLTTTTTLRATTTTNTHCYCLRHIFRVELVDILDHFTFYLELCLWSRYIMYILNALFKVIQ